MGKAFAAFFLLTGLMVVGCGDASTTEGESVDPATAEADTLGEHSITFVRDTGGSVQTNLGYGIVLNPSSSLKRVWITATDSTFPARLIGTAGIRTAYEQERYSGSYEYRATVEVEPHESLSAIEVRFPLFDVWGRFDKTLAMTEVADLTPGQTYSFTPRWNVLSENEASEYWASMAFIARVRTSDGRVIEFPLERILEEARDFSASVTLQDLSLEEASPDTALSDSP